MTGLSGWQRRPIRDLYRGLFDGPHATPAPSDTGPIFLGIKNITPAGRLDLSDVRHIAEEDFEQWTRRVLPAARDIVFSYEATLNLYAVIPPGFRGCLGRRLALIRPNGEVADARFLFYYFFSREWRDLIASKVNIGSTVDRIPLTDFPNFEVRVPPIATQRKISAVLSAYDDLIENGERRIRILDEMAQTLYREWFVEFRFPGHEEVRKVHSSVGDVPVGWVVSRLEEVCERITDGSHQSPASVEKGLPMASVKDMRRWGLDLSGCRHISPADFAALVKQGCMPRVHDVLIAKDGATCLEYVFVLPESAQVVLLSSVAILRANGRLRPHILALGLREPSVKARLKNYVSGAAIPRVVLKDFRRFEIVVPPEEVQVRWSEIAEPMLAQCRMLDRENEVLKRTRDLLLPRLISGELDVSNLDIAVPESGA